MPKKKRIREESFGRPIHSDPENFYYHDLERDLTLRCPTDEALYRGPMIMIAPAVTMNPT